MLNQEHSPLVPPPTSMTLHCNQSRSAISFSALNVPDNVQHVQFAHSPSKALLLSQSWPSKAGYYQYFASLHLDPQMQGTGILDSIAESNSLTPALTGTGTWGTKKKGRTWRLCPVFLHRDLVPMYHHHLLLTGRQKLAIQSLPPFDQSVQPLQPLNHLTFVLRSCPQPHCYSV